MEKRGESPNETGKGYKCVLTCEVKDVPLPEVVTLERHSNKGLG